MVVKVFAHDGISLSRQYALSKSECIGIVATYTAVVPKLWNETIEAHRRAVIDATLDTTWALVTEHGPLSVTMSQIAEKTGIGRATLLSATETRRSSTSNRGSSLRSLYVEPVGRALVLIRIPTLGRNDLQVGVANRDGKFVEGEEGR